MLPQNNYFSDYRKLARLINEGTVFTAFDTETTGLEPEKCRIVEIGAVQFDKSGILRTYNTLINPQIDIPLQIQAINHITNDMVAFSPVVQTILPDFISFISNSMLVAHNAGFDLSFLNTELLRCNMKPLRNRAIDTLTLSRWAYPQLTSHKLQYLAEVMHIPSGTAHRACDDASVCKEVFLRCIHDTDTVQKK